MSSLTTQDLIAPRQTSTSTPTWEPPEWTPALPSADAPGLSDEQQALDQTAASEAGMGPTEVDTLGTFGLRPSELDPQAAQRMTVGMKRMQALLACEGGNDTACELAGPGMVGHQTSEGFAGDSSEDLVVQDADFTLRITTRTTPDGQTERVLLYQDVDGNFVSGVSTEPLETVPESQPAADQAPAPDEEGLSSFLEGAILGDFAGNDSWSAFAGQTVVGLIPVVGQIADARDTIAAIKDVAEGKEGAWLRLAAAGIGWIPGIGDVLKDGARVGRHLGTEVVEEGAERLVKEGAEEAGERAAKHEAEEATEEAAERTIKESDEVAVAAAHTAPSRAADPSAAPRGRRTTSRPNDTPDRIRSDMRENEAADTLARNGYDIEQNPSVPGAKRPDYCIEGKIFDNIAPVTDKPRNIWDRALDKIDEEQTERIVLNLDDSAVDLDGLRMQFANWPIAGLQEVLVVRAGQVIPLFP